MRVEAAGAFPAADYSCNGLMSLIWYIVRKPQCGQATENSSATRSACSSLTGLRHRWQTTPLLGPEAAMIERAMRIATPAAIIADKAARRRRDYLVSEIVAGSIASARGALAA